MGVFFFGTLWQHGGDCMCEMEWLRHENIQSKEATITLNTPGGTSYL